MSNTIDNARKYFRQAQEIKGSSISFLRGHIEKARGLFSSVSADKHLSDSGRAVKLSQTKAKAAQELLQQIHTKRQEYAVNMRKAITLAEATIHAKAPQPDATKLERFEIAFRTLKTEIMLSTRPERAVERLTQFVERIDDAYLANVVREQYAEVVGPVIAAAGSDGGVKLALAKTFDQLKTRFETPEIAEARNIVEVASIDVDAPRLFHRGLAETAVDDMFTYSEEGRVFQPSRFINDTEAYFEPRPEVKPADYVDVDPLPEEKPKPSGNVRTLAEIEARLSA